MTATPAEAIDLSADLEKALDEEAQLHDMLSYKRGEIATLRTLITRLRALERGKTDAPTTSDPLAPSGPA